MTLDELKKELFVNADDSWNALCDELKVGNILLIYLIVFNESQIDMDSFNELLQDFPDLDITSLVEKLNSSVINADMKWHKEHEDDDTIISSYQETKRAAEIKTALGRCSDFLQNKLPGGFNPGG